MVGNTNLVNYGIQTESSDIRVHVSISTRRVYIYKTRAGVEAIASGEFDSVPVRTGNYVTAIGHKVPPAKIQGCKAITIPDRLLDDTCISEQSNTSAKGRAAIRIVKEMLKAGLIPLDLSVNEITDEAIQISGLDIIVKGQVKIQVKCDWRGGPKTWGGTGNLFLQTQECNPFRQY